MPHADMLGAPLRGSPRPPPGRYPFPSYPSGWYAVAFATDVPPGRLLSLRYFGRELVLYRTAGGTPVLASAFCPHMGAHLGHGGVVFGERLRCPFHHFEFDGGGACVATPYGQGPPAHARLETWPLKERDGALLVYHDDLGRKPQWEPPAIEWDASWGPLLTHRFEVASHPQETTENSVDTGHLISVHGFRELETLAPLTLDGPHLSVSYAVTRSASFPRPRDVRAEFQISASGLGWSFVDVTVKDLGLRTRQFVYATPIDRERIHLRLATRVGPVTRPSRVHPALALLPAAAVQRVISWLSHRQYLRDVAQDFAVWEHKSYVDPPAVASGDGPIVRYRRWARQFYVEGAEAVGHESAVAGFAQGR